MIFSPKSQSYFLLREVFILAKKKKIKPYIVGGVLRDMIVGRVKENPDIDICVRQGSIAFARELAKKLKCGFAVLDSERKYARVVKKANGKVYTLDFTDLRAKTLEQDLLMRDFTIDALALDLSLVFEDKPLIPSLIDPHMGLKDIRAKTIRITRKDNFKDDPLRMLRAFSLSALFGFEIERSTMELIRRDKERLRDVAYERVREELFKIFESKDSYSLLVGLDKINMLKLVIPEIELMRGVKQGLYHHLDVLGHSFETLKQLEGIFDENKNNKELNGYLDEPISADRKRRSILKLGAFLHDVGKPGAKKRKGRKTIFHGHERIGSDIVEDISRRLKLSNDELGALRKMVFWHLRPGYLADTPPVSARAKFRYFRDAAKEGVSILILSIADQRSTRGPKTSESDRKQHEKICLSLIKEYFAKDKKQTPKRLVNGDMIMAKFGLKPSKLIGKILREIEELQAIGKIKTKKDALAAAKRLVKK